jgi:hypothetical protein
MPISDIFLDSIFQQSRGHIGQRFIFYASVAPHHSLRCPTPTRLSRKTPRRSNYPTRLLESLSTGLYVVGFGGTFPHPPPQPALQRIRCGKQPKLPRKIAVFGTYFADHF